MSNISAFMIHFSVRRSLLYPVVNCLFIDLTLLYFIFVFYHT